MIVEPSGVVFAAQCQVRSERCRAPDSGPVTAVWTTPGREQLNVCGACLPEMVRMGEWEIPGTRIHPRHDIVLRDGAGRPRIVVHVRARPLSGVDVTDWASRIHHNLVRYSGLPPRAAFLLVGFPDLFFFWPADAARDLHRLPVRRAEDAGVLAGHLAASPGTPGPAEREQQVAEWLASVLCQPAPYLDGPAAWLAENGVLDQLRGGSIARQALAA